MAAATPPIRVDVATDELVSYAAHFMLRSKKASLMQLCASTSTHTATTSMSASGRSSTNSIAPMMLLLTSDRDQRRRAR